MKIGSDIVAWGLQESASEKTVREVLLVQNGKARWLAPGAWMDRRAYERMPHWMALPEHLRKPLDVLKDAVIEQQELPLAP